MENPNTPQHIDIAPAPALPDTREVNAQGRIAFSKKGSCQESFGCCGCTESIGCCWHMKWPNDYQATQIYNQSFRLWMTKTCVLFDTFNCFLMLRLFKFFLQKIIGLINDKMLYIFYCIICVSLFVIIVHEINFFPIFGQNHWTKYLKISEKYFMLNDTVLY